MKKIFLLFSISLTLLSYAQAEELTRSGIENQTQVSVTVYNNDLGLIKDLRKIKLPKGSGKLEFMDVASGIQPVTVHVQSLDNPKAFRVLEQNYEYDLMSQEKILDKYVGKNVKLVNWREYQDRKDMEEATLLSNEGQIYQVGKDIYLGHPGYKVVSQIPDNLISKPTLVWFYENSQDDEKSIETTYLTSGISWKADYVCVLNENDTASDLSGWVTIDNRSGAMYKNASLKLVAGHVNRAHTQDMMYAKAGARMAMLDETAPQFEEKSFFEYHLYDLSRKTTLNNNQTKQIGLLQASNVGVKKEYLVRGIDAYAQPYWEPVTKQDVQVLVKIKNSKSNSLGMPLPKGTLRMYKHDDDGSLQFIGEDAIQHTPSDEELKLNIGKAFDIVAERSQTSYKQLSSKAHESEWLITLRNHKEEDAIVSVLEPFSSEWKILQKSHEFKKLDAFNAQFDLLVPKKGETQLRYRVQVEYK